MSLIYCKGFMLPTCEMTRGKGSLQYRVLIQFLYFFNKHFDLSHSHLIFDTHARHKKKPAYRSTKTEKSFILLLLPCDPVCIQYVTFQQLFRVEMM